MSIYVPTALKQQVREKYAGCCAYCRTAEALTVAIFEFEHIIPQSAGGQTVYANLCLACPTCNRYKANRTVAIDPRSHHEVALFNPSEMSGATISSGMMTARRSSR